MQSLLNCKNHAIIGLGYLNSSLIVELCLQLSAVGCCRSAGIASVCAFVGIASHLASWLCLSAAGAFSLLMISHLVNV